jgi:glycerophosphoryl diester phosphodiesterase
MFEQLPRPIIFAHRGASAHSPENTLAAFELAIRQGTDGIELDAMLCADGNVVVFHDNTVDRTTDGVGTVKELSLEALKELDAGCSFDEKFCGERIPTLSEVFEAVGNKTIINIELKNYSSPFDSLPQKVAELVRAHNLSRQVFFSSFNPAALRQINKILPEIPIGLLALPGFAGALFRSARGRWIPHQAVHPSLQDTTHRLIKRQHRAGLRVHVYTVNHPQDIAKLKNWDVDGIFTDDPLLARRIIERESTAS